MAGDWIKVSNDLWDKPEIIEIAELTGCDVDAVVGKVQRVWVWFDRQTEDGRARLTLAYVNRLVACPQFAEAMCHVGWLVVDGRHLQLPNFERHNGQSAKARALTGRRVQRLRNGAARTTALPEKRRVREEERDPRRSFPQLAAASQAAVRVPDSASECEAALACDFPRVSDCGALDGSRMFRGGDVFDGGALCVPRPPVSRAACAEVEPCAQCAEGARCRDAPPLPFESPPDSNADPPAQPRLNLLIAPASNPLSTPDSAPRTPHAFPLPTRQQIDAVYAAYPRKVGAAKAKAEIARALRKVPFERLLAAVQQFARSRVGEDPKWTPYPERWFSKERWNDDPREWQHAAANRHATANPHAARLGPGQIYDPDAQTKDPTVGRL